MTPTVDAVNQTILLAFTSAEWTVVSKVLTKSPTEFRDLVVNYLKGKSDGYDQDDRNLIAARLSGLNRTQIDQLKSVLSIP